MTTQRFENTNTAARKVIADFLMENSQPTTEDWKRLIAQHPQHAGDIVDAALLRHGTQRLVEADVAGPVNKSAYEATVSEAINLLHTMPSAQLAGLEEKIAAISGASIRKLAADVGLGAQVALLNSVLAGTVVAPARVMQRLTAMFDTSVAMLAELFRRSFDNREIPAFKAVAGKPELADKPTPWADAVKSLRLSPEQTKELLSLDE
jgi:hypothetical protein